MIQHVNLEFLYDFLFSRVSMQHLRRNLQPFLIIYSLRGLSVSCLEDSKKVHLLFLRRGMRARIISKTFPHGNLRQIDVHLDVISIKIEVQIDVGYLIYAVEIQVRMPKLNLTDPFSTIDIPHLSLPRTLFTGEIAHPSSLARSSPNSIP